MVNPLSARVNRERADPSRLNLCRIVSPTMQERRGFRQARASEARVCENPSTSLPFDLKIIFHCGGFLDRQRERRLVWPPWACEARDGHAFATWPFQKAPS